MSSVNSSRRPSQELSNVQALKWYQFSPAGDSAKLQATLAKVVSYSESKNFIERHFYVPGKSIVATVNTVVDTGGYIARILPNVAIHLIDLEFKEAAYEVGRGARDTFKSVLMLIPLITTVALGIIFPSRVVKLLPSKQFLDSMPAQREIANLERKRQKLEEKIKELDAKAGSLKDFGVKVFSKGAESTRNLANAFDSCEDKFGRAYDAYQHFNNVSGELSEENVQKMDLEDELIELKEQLGKREGHIAYLNDEIEKLKEKISAEDDIKILEQKKRQCEGSILDLTQKKEALEKNLEEKVSTIKDLSIKTEEARAAVNKAIEEKDAVEKAVAKFAAEKNKYEQEIPGIQAEFDKLVADKRAVLKEIAASNKKLASLQADFDKLQTSFKEAENKVKEVTAKKLEEISALESAKAERVVVEASCENSQKTLNQMNLKIEQLNKEFEVTTAALQEEKDLQIKENQTLSNENKAIEKSILEKRVSIENLSTENSVLLGTVEKLKVEMALLKEEIAKGKQEARDKASESAHIEVSIKNQNKQLESLKTKVEKQTQLNLAREVEFNELTKKRELIQADLVQFEAKLQSIGKSTESAESHMKALSDKLDLRAKEVDLQLSELEASIANKKLEEERVKLNFEKTVAEKEEIIAAKAEEESKLTAIVEELQKQESKLTSQIADGKEKLKKVVLDGLKATNEKIIQKQKLKDISNEIKRKERKSMGPSSADSYDSKAAISEGDE